MEDFLKNLRGTKDFMPQEQKLRNRIRKVCEETFELYGCKPLETPILNTYELMAYKYGGGSEILKEVYQFKDQGERELALRYDLTTPFTKIIAQNPEMRFPFKRYEIGKVFRDGAVKLGRLREFVQCDVDIVGVKSVSAEAELMMMAFNVFQKLELQVLIQYNNRKLLSGILAEFEVKSEQVNDVILSLDKLEKIGIDGVMEELVDKEIDTETINRIEKLIRNPESRNVTFFKGNFSNPDLLEGVKELEELRKLLGELGIDADCVFNPFLARGLNIYTGTIYEIFLKEGERSITSAIGSGGRYDRIIRTFIDNDNDKEYPAVGISFGLDVIFYALKEKSGLSGRGSVADVLIVPLGTISQCMKMAQIVRKNGIKVEVELANRKLNKVMNYADKEGFPFVMIVGENEIQSNSYILRNMVSGEEKAYTLEEIESLRKL